MKRGELITLLAACPLAARAQQPATPVIGFLHLGSEGVFGHVVEGFRRGLAASDFLEGPQRSRRVSTEGQLDRLSSLAADLLRRDVAVIVGGGPVAQAATVLVACRQYRSPSLTGRVTLPPGRLQLSVLRLLKATDCHWRNTLMTCI